MQKKKERRKLSRFLIVALILATSLVSSPAVVQAADSFESVQDTVTDSDIGQTGVTHTIVASTSQAVSAGGYIEIVFPAEFTVIATTSLVCPNSGAGHGSGNTLQCFYASGVEATSSTFTVGNVTNANAGGSYLFYIYNKQANGTITEQSTFRVAILNDVAVTASVPATLTFSVLGLPISASINGVTTTGSSTMTTLDFGTLSPGSAYTMGQKLKVSTNATYGFTVTVAQDHNLISSGGADIDSFKDGVEATTTPLAWAAPTGVIGQEKTYGHFGLTSDDSTLSDGDPFGASLYKGFNDTDPIEVMYNSGPADGSTQDIGTTTVAYTIQVNAMQESGDYSNSLTYICTPTY